MADHQPGREHVAGLKYANDVLGAIIRPKPRAKIFGSFNTAGLCRNDPSKQRTALKRRKTAKRLAGHDTGHVS